MRDSHHAAISDQAGIELGPIGLTVADNIERLLRYGRMSYAELSRRLEELGRPIPPLGLTRIRDGKRRVDVDDLVALALALDVSPVVLLLPLTESPDDQVAVTEAGPRYTREQLRGWLRGLGPINAELLPTPVEPIRVFVKRPGEPTIELAPISDSDELRKLGREGEGPVNGDDRALRDQDG